MSGECVKMEWIRVEDRLPIEVSLNDAPNVLITDGENVSVGWYEHNLEETDENGKYFPEEQIWHDNAGYLTTDVSGWPEVTHWMPLPQPPEQTNADR